MARRLTVSQYQCLVSLRDLGALSRYNTNDFSPVGGPGKMLGHLVASGLVEDGPIYCITDLGRSYLGKAP